jgi:hypothetical protein
MRRHDNRLGFTAMYGQAQFISFYENMEDKGDKLTSDDIAFIGGTLFDIDNLDECTGIILH